MFTTDLALKTDPAYREISQRFLNNPEEFEMAFAKAWFKLTHRDMGPRSRYVGSDVPDEVLTWMDPVPVADGTPLNAGDIKDLKNHIKDSGLSNAELVRTAWASAASFRGTDMRGGANGARVALAPQNSWAVNSPDELTKVLDKLKEVQAHFNRGKHHGKHASLADVIVLGGAVGIEQAAKAAGNSVSVPFTPGRGDATQAQTDAASFAVLEPKADGFRNYYSEAAYLSPVDAMIDRANLLNLTVPEMTALVGGMRAINANAGGASHGVFTDQPGTLSNDFFVNLLDMSTEWVKGKQEGVYEGRDRTSGDLKWTATPVDLMFGSSSELRAIAEVYAENGGETKFLNDFVAAWSKVMTLDRFDLN